MTHPVHAQRIPIVYCELFFLSFFFMALQSLWSSLKCFRWDIQSKVEYTYIEDWSSALSKGDNWHGHSEHCNEHTQGGILCHGLRDVVYGTYTRGIVQQCAGSMLNGAVKDDDRERCIGTMLKAWECAQWPKRPLCCRFFCQNLHHV